MNTGYENAIKTILDAGYFERDSFLRDQPIYLPNINDGKVDYRVYYSWAISFFKTGVIPNIVKNPFVVFIDNYDINAFASVNSERQIIGLNRGLTEVAFDMFWQAGDVFSEVKFQHYNLASNLIKNQPPWYFLYKYFTKFIFFHELGHLCQSNNGYSFSSEKRIDFMDAKSSELSQLREFDADVFACCFLNGQVKADWAYLPEDCRTNEKYISFAAMALTAMMIFFEKSSERHPQLYFEGKSHPHPLVRLAYVTKYLESSRTIEPDTGQKDVLFSQALDLTFAILGINRNQFLGKVLSEMDRIENYIECFEKDVRKPGFALYNYFGS